VRLQNASQRTPAQELLEQKAMIALPSSRRIVLRNRSGLAHLNA
jgi:hypothetical protein